VAIQTVGVVGLGTMGAGIVEVFARNGFDVVAVEVDDVALERGRTTLTASTQRAMTRGRLTEGERDALLSRVRFEIGMAALRDVDLVIEAVPERIDLKRRLFAQLDEVCHAGAILATNTSSLSVTEIATATRRPQDVIGVHFFNPAPVMRLVEIVRTVVTADPVVEAVEAMCVRLGKVGVTIGDQAGFIANALLFGYLNQAISMYETGYVGREDLDMAMRLGAGLPMGPLQLLDLIGLDTAYEILDTMYSRGGRNLRHVPAPLLRELVTAGLVGRKCGRGFYTYAAPGSTTVVADELTPPRSDGDRAGTSAAQPIRTVGVVGSGAADVLEIFAALGDVVTTVSGESLDELTGVDLVIEAAGGGIAATREAFARFDAVCRPGTILATTSSTVPVVECAMATTRPQDVVGLHFPHLALPYNGTVVAGTRLVEVVTTVRTSPATRAAAVAVAHRLDTFPVVCADRAGYVVHALLFPYLNDAIRLHETGYAGVDDIDHAMTLGCGYPVGPFAQLDAIGLDAFLAVQRALYQAHPEPALAPAPLVEHLVTAGFVGRGAARGFRPGGGTPARAVG
jgi:3-hydroxybutyryl-CoA dehydrogenase